MMLYVTLTVVVMQTCLLAPSGTASRILLVSQQTVSHVHEQLVLGQELVQRGHEVWVILGNTFPRQVKIQEQGMKVVNFLYPDGHVTLFSMEHQAWMGEMMFTGSKAAVNMVMNNSRMTLEDCGFILQDKVLMDQLRSVEFDLSIADGFGLSPCSLLIPEYLGIPFTCMSVMIMPTWSGIPALPSFVPGPVIGASDAMSFMERILNVLSYFVLSNTFTASVAGIQGLTDTALLKKYAPDIKDFIHLTSKAKFYICTSDHHLNWPSPGMPYLLQLPGITPIAPNHLPTDLQVLADSATDGIILVSFGSATAPIPVYILKDFLDSFRGLNQTVIWKREQIPKELQSQVPRNVHCFPWLSQNDLLGHPKMKVFITHCGNNGQYEALYHGVPMIGFPLYGDQYHNALRIQAKGLGIQMDILNFNASDLRNNILHVIYSENFKAKAYKYKQILQSRPLLPREEAADMVEHVIRFGDEHLRSSARDMPLYQLYVLDVLAFLFVIAFATCTLLVWSIVSICKRLLRNSGPVKFKKQ